MILIGVIAGVFALVLLLDAICRFIDRWDYVRRLEEANADLIEDARDDQATIRRLQNRVRAGRWAISSEAERRCAELELELQKLQKKIEIKDAMLRAMLPAEKNSPASVAAPTGEVWKNHKNHHNPILPGRKGFVK